MKKIIIHILPFLLLTSCAKQYIQIFDTTSLNTKLIEGGYVYDNDTVKITYTFWANQGIMSFNVYNKMDKPIYIDWKNSSFIAGEHKLDYWVDEIQTSTASYYAGYYYKGPLIRPGFTVNEGVHNSSSVTSKQERITFIPPKSSFDWSKFYLFPYDYYKLSTTTPSTIVQRNDNPQKTTTLYNQTFDYSNSPIKFRNYLAISFGENSQQFFFIDNAFYLSSITEMKYEHFRLKRVGTDKDGNVIFEKYPFKKMSSFYIKIKDEMNSVELRKIYGKKQ